MELVVTTVGPNQLNAVLSGYGFLTATVGSRQGLLQPVAREVASRRGGVGEGRGAATTSHGHKLWLVKLHSIAFVLRRHIDILNQIHFLIKTNLIHTLTSSG